MKSIALISLSLILCGLNYASAYQHQDFATPDVTNSQNFAKVQAGSFQMGSVNSENYQGSGCKCFGYPSPLHNVVLTKGFEIQKTTVTQGQYYQVMGEVPSYEDAWDAQNIYCPDDYINLDSRNMRGMCANQPVYNLMWKQVQSFIDKLNSMDQHYQYRLPTEAEWEYSARAGTQTEYWFGNDYRQLETYAWDYQNSRGHVKDVGLKLANHLGLYDMAGNIFQLVSDFYGEISPTDQVDPKGPALGKARVIRGGSFLSHSFDNGTELRSSWRGGTPDARGAVGFRLVRIAK